LFKTVSVARLETNGQAHEFGQHVASSLLW